MITSFDIHFIDSSTFWKSQINYFSILNFFDSFRTAWGIVRATIRIFFLYPDVVFGKGGYGSVPTLFAARLFRIPVVIHESDAEPGRVHVEKQGEADAQDVP